MDMSSSTGSADARRKVVPRPQSVERSTSVPSRKEGGNLNDPSSSSVGGRRRRAGGSGGAGSGPTRKTPLRHVSSSPTRATPRFPPNKSRSLRSLSPKSSSTGGKPRFPSNSPRASRSLSPKRGRSGSGPGTRGRAASTDGSAEGGTRTKTNLNKSSPRRTKTREKTPPRPRPPIDPKIKEKFCKWAASFARLDPRIRIHRFFQGISQKGEMKLQQSSGAGKRGNERHRRKKSILWSRSKGEEDKNDLDRSAPEHNSGSGRRSRGGVGGPAFRRANTHAGDGGGPAFRRANTHAGITRKAPNGGQEQEQEQQQKSAMELLASCFNMASIFSVWRPCSNEAIRKMMEGKGVGKGLNIKGKSARHGKCSAYVPFLQVHNQQDKYKIDFLPRDARVRIFYPTRTIRDMAMRVAIEIRDEMVSTIAELEDDMDQQLDYLIDISHRNNSTGTIKRSNSMDKDKGGDDDDSNSAASKSGSGIFSLSSVDDDSFVSLQSNVVEPPEEEGGGDFAPPDFAEPPVLSSTESEILTYSTAQQQKQQWEMTNPSVDELNEYEKDHGVFGMELPERLLWEAFVIRQDRHCRQWELLQESIHHHGGPTARKSTDSSCTTACQRKENFAELLMEEMLRVSFCQDVTAPVIEWIDEVNNEGGDGTSSRRTSAVSRASQKTVGRGSTRSSAVSRTSIFSAWDMYSSAETLGSFTSHTTIPSGNGGIRKPSSWSFVIIDQERFVEQVLVPIKKRDNSFKIKYSCFVGELRRSGFEEQTTGFGVARFRHDYFQKDRPELAALIGGEHCTGRPSSPGYQDANFKSLRSHDKKRKSRKGKRSVGGSPRVVLWNLDDEDNPICPHNLMMAYEENGRVVPVVSDFDGFLVGTKRIRFNEELPAHQVDLIKSNIKTTEEILDGNAMGRTWADKWKYAGRDHFPNSKKRRMPRFGYGDPKSYQLMKAAATQMAKLDGAIRHGAECFNFEYPQEMDSTFLVISDTIEGKVRWKYVNSDKLHFFLANRIKDGYAFPCNPKWILCDPGWGSLYKSLLQSEIVNTQAALNVWFPPKSGVREMIEEISKKHPTGLSFDEASRKSASKPVELPTVATYNLPSSEGQHEVKLLIRHGSVTKFSRPGLRSGLVCASNEGCIPSCGGVTQALVEAGGKQLLRDSVRLPVLSETSFGPVRCVTGDAKVVFRREGGTYGILQVTHVIYAVGPSYGESSDRDIRDIGIKDKLLGAAYEAALDRAKEQNLEAIAFSLLSAGKRNSRWDPHRALRIAMRTLFGCSDFGSLKEVHVCAFTAEEASALESIAMELIFGPSSSRFSFYGCPADLSGIDMVVEE